MDAIVDIALLSTLLYELPRTLQNHPHIQWPALRSTLFLDCETILKKTK